ncbi:MAG: PEPxxWA-CTERM sorting domain-containing protein [Caulobacteraceae bacterium]|nr:PEPxxWA-CTERM sorting domain-containing protein [Caulobacteraceae bacterium]
MKKTIAAAACAAAAVLGASAASASAVVTFVPGTYYLSNSRLGAPTDTLVVSVTGGTADFALSGGDSETFSVPNNSTPDQLVFGNSPVYNVSSLTSYSWDGSAYPYLTLYTNSVGGGLTIGSKPSDTGSNLVNLFQSTDGSGQVFTISSVPEPASWSLMLAGVALAGATLRSRRRLAVV